MSEIFLVRHGHTVANEIDLLGGNYSLSYRGESQIEAEREKFEKFDFDQIYTSELKRTTQTAAQLFGESVPRERQLKEFNSLWFGDAEERSRQQDGSVAGARTKFDGDFPAFLRECHGDNPYKRADDAIRIMRDFAIRMEKNPEEFKNDRIAIITSDTLMRSIVQQLRDYNMWDRISGRDGLPEIGNLQYIKFTYDNGTLVDIDMPPVQ